jgi:uncharacterized 2Fe-2S/4Fe-4S cluster protein (DUF4445 family)
MANLKKVRIDFEPIGKRVEVEEGATLLDAAQQAGIELAAVCGGMGTCERCRVELVRGALSPVTQIEQDVFTPAELAQGMRLACQASPLDNALVNVPPDSLTAPQRLQLEGIDGSQVENDLIRSFTIQLPEPSLEDLRSDASRLEEAVSSQAGQPVAVRTALLTSFSGNIRVWDWRCRAAVRGGQIIAALPADRAPLGLAVDVGTTKVAAYLLDLESGDVVARSSAMNPQIHYGEDVVSRIFYCMEHERGRSTLQASIVETLNQLVIELCRESAAEPDQVVEAVVVGNTAMHHLFAGLPVQQLGLLPFVPAVSQPIEIPAAKLGLRLAPAAQVYLPANIAGYVGADHVAMMLATDAYRAEDTVVAVDVGTNTEISLVHQGKIYSCSCASGPAFEGAHIHDGMRAANGAIERVRIDSDQVHWMTIGGQPPVGICGSGILDAVAEMARTGVLDARGVLRAGPPFVRGEGRKLELVLADRNHSGAAEDVTLNRRDVQEIMLAKAAIRTGVEILLIQAGIPASRVDRFIVAGAFGTYLDLRSAIQIGMFPDLPLERYSQVGNAAGTGARKMLLSQHARDEAARFAARMQYVELTSHPSFKDVFMDSMAFVKK